MKTKIFLLVLTLILSLIVSCQSENEPSEVAEMTSPVSPIAVATEATEEPSAPEDILTPVSELVEESVTFETEDGTELTGTIYGESDSFVVITHAPGGNVEDLVDQAKLIAAQGFKVLLYDVPEETLDLEKYISYIKAAVELGVEQGATENILLGVGESGIASAKAAPQTGAKAVVFFSTPIDNGEVSITSDDMQAINGPILFVDSESSPTQPDAVQLFEWANNPKTWRFSPGSAQGVDIYAEEAVVDEFIAAFFLLRLSN